MPRPRALGSTRRIRNCAVSSSRSTAEHATGPGAVDLGDPRLLASRPVVGEVGGDDLGDEGLERDVPCVLVVVDLAVALDDPTEIATAEPADGHVPVAIRIEDVIEGVDRPCDPLAIVTAERFEEGSDLCRRAAIEVGRDRPPGRRERDADVAAVDVGALRRDELGTLQLGDDAGEVARVHPQPAA